MILRFILFALTFVSAFSATAAGSTFESCRAIALKGPRTLLGNAPGEDTIKRVCRDIMTPYQVEFFKKAIDKGDGLWSSALAAAKLESQAQAEVAIEARDRASLSDTLANALMIKTDAQAAQAIQAMKNGYPVVSAVKYARDSILSCSLPKKALQESLVELDTLYKKATEEQKRIIRSVRAKLQDLSPEETGTPERAAEAAK